MSMKRIKITGVLLLAVFALVVFLQNTETIETHILFFKVTMSRAAALSLSFFSGLIIGGTLVGLRKHRRPM